MMRVIWSTVSGPGTVTFADAGATQTTASFSAAGVYVLRLSADDGALSASDELTVTVQSAPVADTTRPTVRITAPQPGQGVTVQTLVAIAAEATDNVGVTKVEFLVNGSRKCSDTAAPYTCAWTVPQKHGVTYRLKAKAWDAAGNTKTSDVVSVVSQ